jgi:phenylalanyl-tRNA synthetase beta chain
MYAPVSWIDEFIGVAVDVEDLGERLTMAGIEVDGVRLVGVANPFIVAGRLVEIRAHSKEPGLYLARVDVGGEAPLDAVSRAPNLAAGAEGRTVAVALEGATIFSRSGEGLEEVRPGGSHGARSDCVLLSEWELGLGENHDGILFLDDLPPGRPLGEGLGQGGGEVVLDIAILPNIARCLGVLGVAREVATVLGVDVPPARWPRSEQTPEAGKSGADLDAELCRRLSTALLSGIEIRPSPPRVQRRLRLCGIEPMNNVVDASNYVMLELGQPTHTYDADRLPSLDLEVRLAHPGDAIRTLSQDEGEPVELPADAVVVAAGGVPVALAGISGGRATAIGPETRRILVESANFAPVAIRRSQAATKLSTSASMRFTRGVDPALTVLAIEHMIALIRETAPAARLEWIRESSVGDECEVRNFNLRIDEIGASIGIEVDVEECRSILGRLGLPCEIAADRRSLAVAVDSSREDIQDVADLVEEIARIHGYDKVAPSLPADPIAGRGRSDFIVGRETARTAMIEAGLREVLTYSMTSVEVEDRLQADVPGAERPPYVSLLNPQSVERSVLRRSLLPEMLLCVARNQRSESGCHIFEIGSVYLADRPGPRPGLPAQPTRLALMMAGPLEPPSMHNPPARRAAFADAVEAIHHLARRLRLTDVVLEPDARPPYQANACAAVLSGGTVVGHVGVVHPRVTRAFDLTLPVVAAELDLQTVLVQAGGTVNVRELSRFPETTFDLSFVVAQGVPAGDLADVAGAALGENLVDLTVFDIYRGPGLAEGHKAVGLRLVVGAMTHAMTHEESRALADRVVAAVSAQLGGELRQ